MYYFSQSKVTAWVLASLVMPQRLLGVMVLVPISSLTWWHTKGWYGQCHTWPTWLRSSQQNLKILAKTILLAAYFQINVTAAKNCTFRVKIYQFSLAPHSRSHCILPSKKFLSFSSSPHFRSIFLATAFPLLRSLFLSVRFFFSNTLLPSFCHWTCDAVLLTAYLMMSPVTIYPVLSLRPYTQSVPSPTYII